MILFTSEICRLMLGFMEDEELYKSYNVFLNECKHLEECRRYVNKGIQFSTSIHGKNLRQLLSDYDYYEKADSSTQTNFSDSNSLDFINKKNVFTSDSYTQTDDTLFNRKGDILEDTKIYPSLSKNNEMELSCDIENIIDFNSPDFSSQKNKASKLSKRKKNLSIKKKCQDLKTPNSKLPFLNNLESKYSPDSETNDSLIDIDFFIKNLCNNDFPEQLAKSINQQIQTSSKKVIQPGTSESFTKDTNYINVTKKTTKPVVVKSLKLQHKLTAFTPKLIPKSKDQIIQSNKLEETDKIKIHKPNEVGNKEKAFDCLDNNLVDILNKNNMPVLQVNSSIFDFDINQFSIGNEEISNLADNFSVPAFETLYEVMNKNDPDPIDIDTMLSCSTTIEPNPIIEQNELNINSTGQSVINKSVRLIPESIDKNDIIRFGISENKKSMIVISKAKSKSKI